MLENRESGKVDLMRLRLAARLGPVNWLIEKRYIKALADLNFPERAIAELQTCLGVAPYRAESWQMMSELLQRPAGLTRPRSRFPWRKPTMFTCTNARRLYCRRFVCEARMSALQLAPSSINSRASQSEAFTRP